MKYIKILCILLIIGGLVFYLVNYSGITNIVQADSNTIEVTVSKVSGKDDAGLIQNALNEAKTQLINNTGKKVKITIKSGNYTINSKLHIYSNTYLKLESGTTLTFFEKIKEI